RSRRLAPPTRSPPRPPAPPAPPHLPSFPTRRSSDLFPGRGQRAAGSSTASTILSAAAARFCSAVSTSMAKYAVQSRQALRMVLRSEEHTSELQSHLNLVCRLLLEKKNTNTNHED